MEKRRAAIKGVGGFVPEFRLTNEELEKIVETNDEWIMARTGIKERRILKDKDKAAAYMGTKAAEDVLRKTGTDPKDIGMVILATATPDYLFPPTAALVARNIGAVNAFGYDLLAACSGLLYALSTASQFVETGKYKKVLVVGSDKMSSIVDYTDRATCILFGDGAGALLLEADQEGLGIQDFVMHTNGEGEKHLIMTGGGSLNPPSIDTISNKMHFVYQDGRTVFKEAVTCMANVTEEIMERNSLSGDSIDFFVSHQANKRIINATAERMGLTEDKVLTNIERYGNTTCATIPLVLWDYEKKFKKGDSVVLAAFGGGFTWGSMFLKWAYDPQ